MAVQDYELLLRVRADLQQALQGMNGLSDSLGQVDKSARSAGESADAATARINAMVAATAKQAQVQESVRSTQERAAQAIRGTLSAYDNQGATVDRTRAAVEAYRASLGKRTEATAAAAATRAQTAEMAKLAAAIDPTVAAFEKLDKQEATLKKLYQAGAVGAEDFAKFSAVIDNNRIALTKGGAAMHAFSLNSSMARRELGRLASDIANGNWGRFEQTSMTLANYSGLMSAAFSPLGLAIIAVTGSIAAFALVANDAAENENKFNEAIGQTGNFAGVTASQLEQMAQRITPVNGSLSDSRLILQQLAASGRVSGQALESMGQAAADMAQLTGQSADKAAAEVLKLFDGTAAGAVKANEQYHFLTTAIYDQIKALQDEGDAQGAMDVEARAFHEAAVQRLQTEQEQVRGLAGMWDSVKTAISGAWEALKNQVALATGTASDVMKIKAMEQRKADAQNYSAVAGTEAGAYISPWSSQDEANLQALKAKVKEAEDAASLQGLKQKLDENAVNADAGLDRLAASIDKTYAKKEKIKELNKYFEDLWAGADPGNAKLKGVQRIVAADGTASFAGGLYDQLLAGINDTGRVARGPAAGKGGQAAAAAAQQQLIKALGDEQGALDPVAKIWATYNDEVTKANQLADTAKTKKGADVQAIDAQRNALVQLYATARDKALDQLTDKDRQAWEKLRDSLRTPVEVKLDKALEQIAQLNALLAKGVISSDEYHGALQTIGQNSVTALPSYQGVDASVGGVSSEVAKNLKAQQDLDAAYAQQAADLRAKFRADDLAQQAAYNAARAKLDQDYAKKSAVIDQSRNQLALTASSQFFGQLAGLQQSNNRKIAMVGKAAAIAKAIIDTYQSATSSYAAMASIPYIGPALGAAAAAAAIAAGLANVAAIRSQPTGFATGGRIRGPGTGTSDSVTIRASDGEYMQRAAAVAYYGEDFMDAVNNLEYPRNASDRRMLDSLSSTAGFDAARPELALPANLSTAHLPSSAGAAAQKHVHVWDRDQAAQEIASTPHFEEAVLHVVGNNPTVIQGKWR
ncbi:phage tail length tape measure family protein [Dyella ginsengisoli]|uniref:Phage tail length tape measure family protein n=1 Tax=Dyella ginsengisoli TaxID=363848 RepID=A0ABW8JTU8_9GAMM